MRNISATQVTLLKKLLIKSLKKTYFINAMLKKASQFCKALFNSGKWTSGFIPEFIVVQIKKYINFIAMIMVSLSRIINYFQSKFFNYFI